MLKFRKKVALFSSHIGTRVARLP